MRLIDSLISLITGLGTSKDPTRSLKYTLNILSRPDVENAYRGDWVARKIVNAPAEDATREWREWQAAQPQIDLIEGIEKDLDIQRKTKSALVKARMYGGAALVLGIDQGTADQPLDYDKLTKGCLKFVHVMHQYELAADTRITDIESPWFGRPESYSVLIPSTEARGKGLSGTVKIHPSRVVELVGNELPDWRTNTTGSNWGDSVLQVVDDVVRSVGLVNASIATMMTDAKMDVVKIPEFSKQIAKDPDAYTGNLIKRFAAANAAKSTVNTLVLDKEEEWDRIQTNFGALPDIMRMYLMVASGAADIPASRMLGQAPRGLQGATTAGGEVDIRNYYDRISTEQRTVLAPAMIPLDEALVASALGHRDESVFYEWRPLWQLDDAEKAAIAFQKAQATNLYVAMGIINEDALRPAVANQLIEDGTYPGLQESIDENGLEPPEPEPAVDPVTGEPLPVDPQSGLPMPANKTPPPKKKSKTKPPKVGTTKKKPAAE